MFASPPAVKATLLALVLLLLAQAPSNATLMSARDLTELCSGDLKAGTICDGYLMAVTDAMLPWEGRGRGGGKVCLPSAVTLDQVRDAVLGAARRPRAERAQSGIMLVMMAMRVTFPCGEQQPRQQ